MNEERVDEEEEEERERRNLMEIKNIYR